MVSKFHQTAFALHERPRQHRVKWWRHESDIYKMLGLDSVDELDEFVLQCGRGYSGVGSAKIINQEPFGASIDLQTPGNILGIRWSRFGRGQGGKSPRHYAFEYDNATPVSFKQQQEILQWVQGTHRQLDRWPDMKKRRIESWYDWATGAGGEAYQKHDLPYIAAAFSHCWDADISATANLSQEQLSQVKEEIVELLEASGLIPAKNEPSIIRRVSARTRRVDAVDTASTAATDRRVRQRVDESSDESDSSEEDSDDEVNESISIDYGHLRKKWFDEHDYIYVGSIEYTITQVYAGNTNLSQINTDIEFLGGCGLSEEHFDSIKLLSKQVLSRKLKNFTKLRQVINDAMPTNLFHIRPEMQLLKWVSDGSRYSNGEQMPRKTHSISRDNKQKQLTDESAYMLYKMYVAYDLSLSKLNGLLNCMAVYFLGRRLELTEFSSTTTTLRNWFKRSSLIDRHLSSMDDLQTFGYKSPNGFPVLYYIVTDDTKHGKHDTRHAVIRTGVYSDGRPRYIVLTSSSAVTKDAKGNAALNLEVIKKLVHPDVIPFLGGGTVDNAGSARVEMKETNEELMTYLEAIDKTELTMFFGVLRRTVIIPDWFHIDNLTIQAASTVFSGDPERGNFGQFHPRQLIQSIYDIHSRVPEMSQQIVDDILRECSEPTEYTLRPLRERPQRWRVNGIAADRILAALDITLPDGENLMARWAAEMFLLGGKVGGADCAWIKDTASQIAVMSKSKSIVISLTFEMELVTMYFDITHGEHAYKGEMKRRAGFITLELPRLMLDFIIPFWLTAKKDPSKCFPKTHKRIMDLEDEELKEMKLEQLDEAMAAALDKVSKNSELLMEAPLIFLLLTHPVEGPYVLRAVISCLMLEEFDLNEADNIFFDEYCNEVKQPEYKFSTLTYEDQDSLDGMDPKERVYFDQLEPNSDDVVHWFRQIGLARAVVREELIVMVQEKPSDRDPDSKTPLQDFKRKYPILYDLLFSFVGYSASNSRIVELLHAFTRQIYDPNMPMECLDNRLNHMMGDEYVQRDDRRDVSKQNRDPSLPYSKPKHLDRKKTQQMQGEQMLEGAKKYNASAIAALPPEFQEQIKIKHLNKQGHTTMEKQYKDALQSAWEERKSNKLSRSARQLDLVELGQEAAQALSEHDKQWSKRGNVQLSIITEKMATKTHFNSVPVANDAFYNEIMDVLPYIGESFDPPLDDDDEILEALKRLKKKGVMAKDGILGRHLNEVRLIAQGKADNTFSAELADKTEDEILQVFVCADGSSKMAETQDAVANKWRKMENIYHSAATEIAPRFLKIMNGSPEQNNNSESDGNDATEQNTQSSV